MELINSPSGTETFIKYNLDTDYSLKLFEQNEETTNGRPSRSIRENQG